MLRKTWPLIVYTILIQLAAGLCTFLAAYLWSPASPGAVPEDGTVIMAAGVAVSAAMALSTLHLGQPFRAYRALTNIRTSWLSREILSTAVFFALIALCGLAGSMGVDTSTYRWLATSAALGGIAAIMVMAGAYSTTGKDAWSGYGPHALFLVSTLVLGAAGTTLLAGSIGAVRMPTRGILGLAVCLSFGLIAAALTRNKDEYRYRVTLAGSALSLLGMIMIYAAALSMTPEMGVFLSTFAAAILLSGELIGRYAFMCRGLVENPESRISLGVVFKDLLFRIPFTMRTLLPGHGETGRSHCADDTDGTQSACARLHKEEGYTGLPVSYPEPPKTQPEKVTFQSRAQMEKSNSGVTMSDTASTATLEDISVEDFFTTFLPGKTSDMLALLSTIDLSFMAGKDFRCQFDIDDQVYSIILKNGNALDFIKGAIERPHVVAKVAEKDWRDAITGKFNSSAQYYTGDITSLFDAKRYKAVITLKGGLNLSLKMDDGRVLGLRAIFNGTHNPSVDLSLAMKDYLAVLSKTVSTQALIITNKVKFKGNMMLLLKFQNLL